MKMESFSLEGKRKVRSDFMLAFAADGNEM